jgi:flagella basal body P-ring formation protein FlgA
MRAAAAAANTLERTAMNIRNCLLACLLLGFSSLCQASIEPAQLAQINRAVEQLIERQTAGLPGKVSFTIGAIDPRLNLPGCAAPQAFLPAGTRLWGRASVGVRCSGTYPWTIYVPVSVQVMSEVAVAAHALAQGHVLQPGDLALQEADLGRLPGAVVTNPEQALGRILTVSLAPGQPLRQDLLRAPPAIQQGQSVTLRAQGAGFVISASGKAVNNAAEGQIAQVRTPSGRTINGIARLGAVVEIQ